MQKRCLQYVCPSLPGWNLGNWTAFTRKESLCWFAVLTVDECSKTYFGFAREQMRWKTQGSISPYSEDLFCIDALQNNTVYELRGELLWHSYGLSFFCYVPILIIYSLMPWEYFLCSVSVLLYCINYVF